MRKRALALLGLGFVAGCGVSQQQEVQMGQQEVAQIQQQLPMVNDAVIDGYVNQLGQRIAKLTSRGDLDWHFSVVNSSDVNAFAVPGGFIYINRGVLEHASQMDELAGVMGHEIEHVVLRHTIKQMQQTQEAQTGVTIACVLTRVCNSQVAQAGINVAGTLVFAKFSRTDEQQADEGGFQNVMRAGISPRGMLSFFQKLLAEEQAQGSSSAAGSWFADHPGTQDRIADIQRMLNQVPAAQLNALQTNESAFNTMKRRLAQLPPAPPTPSQ